MDSCATTVALLVKLSRAKNLEMSVTVTCNSKSFKTPKCAHHWTLGVLLHFIKPATHTGNFRARPLKVSCSGFPDIRLRDLLAEVKQSHFRVRAVPSFKHRRVAYCATSFQNIPPGNTERWCWPEPCTVCHCLLIKNAWQYLKIFLCSVTKWQGQSPVTDKLSRQRHSVKPDICCCDVWYGSG